jgi:hypothetical protein
MDEIPTVAVYILSCQQACLCPVAPCVYTGVLRGLYTTAESLAPEGASDESPGSGRSWPAMSGGGLSSESVRSRATTLMTGAGVGGVSYK